MSSSRFQSTLKNANGNIETVERFDETGTQYDDLAYHYEQVNNKLLRNRLYHLNESINGGYGDIGVDASTFHGAHGDVNLLNNYKYDELGNLIADKREEITNIEWTVSGKVKRITRTVGSTKPELWFAYGADGQRISKTVGDPLNGGYREWYVRDAQGNIMAMYKYANNGMSLKVTERPIYGSKRIGTYVRQMELMGEPAVHQWPYTQPMQAPLKRYELTDHLGNVNTVVTGRLLPLLGPGVQYQAEVVSATGYEPFGSLLPGRNYSSASSSHLFQGQEHDDEIYGATGTSYAFTYRMHDPRIGRFWSIDPLAAKYPMYSPYHFSSNQPIHAPELEGKESAWDLNSRDPNYQRMSPQERKEFTDRTYGPFLDGFVGMATLSPLGIELRAAWLAGGWRAALSLATKQVIEEGVSRAFQEVTGIPMVVSPRDVTDLARGLGRTPRFLANKLAGESNKIAVIGQGMEDVEKIAKAVPGAEIFKPSTAAQKEWDQLLKDANGGHLSDDVVQGTKVYKENQSWIQKIKDDGYNVIDLGVKEGAAPSTFYNMERKTVDGQ